MTAIRKIKVDYRKREINEKIQQCENDTAYYTRRPKRKSDAQ